MRLLIVSGMFKKRFHEEMIKFMKNTETKIVPFESFTKKIILPMWPNREGWDEICHFKPDVILTDCTHYPQFYAKVYSMIKRNNTKLLTFLRGNFWTETEFYYNSICTRENLENGITTYHLTKRFQVFYYFHHIYLANRAIRLSDKVLPICKWLENEIKKKLPNMPTEVFYQGINPDIFRSLRVDSKDKIEKNIFRHPPRKTLWRWEHPAVGILQNHTIYPKAKGLIDFARVIKRLPDVHFYISGGEEKWGGGYFHYIKEALERFKNVHFTGEIPYERVRDFMNSCDLYVLASGLDCCPTSVLEAGLCEKPVLGSRVGGIPELIKEGKTGWTIPNENIDEWVEKIELLLENRRLAHRMGKTGRQFVIDNFSWKVLGKQLGRIMGEMR